MAKLYTPKQRSDVLKSLGIKSIDKKVTGDEAAKILTWRAQQEHNIVHIYNTASIRRHVHDGNIHPGEGHGSRYPVEQVFDLPIAPMRRGRYTKSQ